MRTILSSVLIIASAVVFASLPIFRSANTHSVISMECVSLIAHRKIEYVEHRFMFAALDLVTQYGYSAMRKYLSSCERLSEQLNQASQMSEDDDSRAGHTNIMEFTKPRWQRQCEVHRISDDVLAGVGVLVS